jgi:uncharacterized protein (TIGR03437 family)
MRIRNLIAAGRFAACLALPVAGWAQGQLQCQRADNPGTVRAEGVSELLNDIVLTCSGGLTIQPGRALPTYNLLVTGTVPLTSRALAPSNQNSGLSEALLLVNDPPFASQVGCVPQTGGQGCTEAAGAALSPNIFQGRQIQYNLIAFRNFPFNPPGPGLTSTLRITNLRVNASGVLGQPQPTLQVSLSMTDANGANVPIEDTTKLVATALASVQFMLRTSTDAALPIAGPALTVPPGSLASGQPQAAQAFNVKFTEGFASAFKRRNVGTNSLDPLLTTVQATPGLNYGTESGFFNNLLPSTTGMNLAGLADTGTRLRIVFRNVPAGAGIWVSARDVANGTTGYSAANAKALLTGADGNGLGPLTVLVPQTGAYVEIPVVNGTASADWEVINADPSILESFSFSVALTATTSSPAQGIATIAGGIAPLAGEVTVTIPAFEDVSIAVPGFAISNEATSPALAVLSATFASGASVAPGSIVSGFGSKLAASSAAPQSLPLPITLANTAVNVIDAAGTLRASGLYLVSPGQVNFVMDPLTVTGPALILVQNGTGTVASGAVEVDNVAPGLFSANSTGSGVAAGQVLRSVNGVTSTEQMAVYDVPTSAWLPVPIKLDATDLVFLALYGTGIRNRASISDVRVTINSITVPVTYAGPQSQSPGLDQLNIGPLPLSLQGSGIVNIRVSIGNSVANAVTVQIQ